MAESMRTTRSLMVPSLISLVLYAASGTQHCVSLFTQSNWSCQLSALNDSNSSRKSIVHVGTLASFFLVLRIQELSTLLMSNVKMKWRRILIYFCCLHSYGIGSGGVGDKRRTSFVLVIKQRCVVCLRFVFQETLSFAESLKYI